MLAHPLEQELAALGAPGEWQVEWKWDGIRAQLIRRAGRVVLWSRGEESIAGRFPEIAVAAQSLPDGTVLDGEVLAWRGDRPLPFAKLQRRIGRIAITAKVLADAPAVFLAYDLLEEAGADRRDDPLAERRARLEALLGGGRATLRLSPLVAHDDWEALPILMEESRDRGVEGFMLKRRDSPYRAGRRKGDWWKWKVDPFHVDAVLLYAQPGHGRRASLFTDYTFGVWHEGALVPIAKAYSGLTDAEIREVDAFVRRRTTERFGPVRAVQPELVFELAFEGIQASPRHKAGIALRFPRMARWRRDKPASEADTLEALRSLLATEKARG
jgi:DNA ligase-1